MAKFKTFLVFGPNGIGKGTNAKAVGVLPGYLHFSTGDMFRALTRRVETGEASELEKRIRATMQSGGLVDDQTTVSLSREYLERQVKEGKFDPATDYLLLDGMPRNVEQARMIEEFIEVIAVLHITAEREVAVERITGRARIEGRQDDMDAAAVGRRLDIFFEHAAKILAFYDRGFDGRMDYRSEKIRHIDAARRPVRVLEDVLRYLP